MLSIIGNTAWILLWHNFAKLIDLQASFECRLWGHTKAEN